MNTTNILLGTTSLLLVVAFALSFGGLNKNRGSAANKKEYEEIRAELEKQKALYDQMQLENLRNRAASVTTPITPSPSTPIETAPLDDDIKKKLQETIERQKDEIVELEVEKDKAEIKAKVNEKETLLLMREKTKLAQRQQRDAQRVTTALLMGMVDGFNKEYGFLTFTPTENGNFQPGQELGIRRNSGILGRITIDRLQGNQYIANVKENAYAGGIPEIVEGDEIIVVPRHYGVSGE